MAVDVSKYGAQHVSGQSDSPTILCFRPNADIFKLMLVKAKEGKYIPFTNTDQDVIETVFAVDSSFVTPERDFLMGKTYFYGKAPFPAHYHRAHVSHPAKNHNIMDAWKLEEKKYWDEAEKSLLDCKSHNKLVDKYIGKDDKIIAEWAAYP